MTLNAETLTALSALSGRIIATSMQHPQSPMLAEIYKDLSPVERATLHAIFESERRGHEVQLNQKQTTALSLLQERLCQKSQTEAFVPTELKALSQCTGKEWPETSPQATACNNVSSASNHHDMNQSGSADQPQWKSNNEWFF